MMNTYCECKCACQQTVPWMGISLGDGIKIVGPDDVVEQMRSEIKRLIEHYS